MGRITGSDDAQRQFNGKFLEDLRANSSKRMAWTAQDRLAISIGIEPAKLHRRHRIILKRKMLSSMEYTLQTLKNEGKVSEYWDPATRKKRLKWPDDLVSEILGETSTLSSVLERILRDLTPEEEVSLSGYSIGEMTAAKSQDTTKPTGGTTEPIVIADDDDEDDFLDSEGDIEMGDITTSLAKTVLSNEMKSSKTRTDFDAAQMEEALRRSLQDEIVRLQQLVQDQSQRHQNSERDILQLIRASPEALRHYVQYRPSIMRHRIAEILSIDCDGSIIQDAQAVIHFPPIDTNSPVSTTSILAITRCLDTWKDGRFPEYSRQYDAQNISRLYRFFSRLITFIEDYLAKSLDPSPARACMALPEILSIVPRMHFKGRDVDVEPAAFGAMREPERRCLLQAFVRYELLCKVYHPKVWPYLEGTTYADIVTSSHERMSLKAYEALYCVHEYLKSLYGAVFAQCQDSWFPDRPTCSEFNVAAVNQTVEVEPETLASCKNYGLLFPDNVYFDMQQYSCGLMNGMVRDILPCLGFDLLSSVLISLATNGTNGQYLRTWFHALSYQYSTDCTPWTSNPHFVGRRKSLSVDDTDIRDWQMRMECYIDSFRFIPGVMYSPLPDIDIEQQIRQFRIHNIQLKIFRQRAWVFFHDSRMSTISSPLLPSWSELVSEDEATKNTVALAHQRDRRRSQKWQDYWSGRTLDHPFEQHEEDTDTRELVANVTGNRRDVPRFFEKP
ncbi:hypothetical protein CEP52_016590 [Fusarium oligoseptatum]|uniref:Uncharacterized protein n=1 Tax=Fusarium oligoseptatum TaxID=2604345 RepID=A0A428S246_9HYPO|nr:hypothetical protein CEP52_016590 [Fusarium oligoseptatum]